MTSLIYYFSPEIIYIATDSLSCRNKSPFHFITKILPLPHLQSVICGTGSADLIIDWFTFIQRNFTGNNIYHLDQIAPVILPIIASEQGSGNMISTIYEFGYDEDIKKFVGFAYKSANNFISQKLDYNLVIKPGYGELQQTTIDIIDKEGIISAFIKFMIYQKQFDEKLSLEEQVCIGGEIHLLRFEPFQYTLKICHQFHDYLQHFKQMIANQENIV